MSSQTQRAKRRDRISRYSLRKKGETQMQKNAHIDNATGARMQSDGAARCDGGAATALAALPKSLLLRTEEGSVEEWNLRERRVWEMGRGGIA